MNRQHDFLDPVSVTQQIHLRQTSPLVDACNIIPFRNLQVHRRILGGLALIIGRRINRLIVFTRLQVDNFLLDTAERLVNIDPFLHQADNAEDIFLDVPFLVVLLDRLQRHGRTRNQDRADDAKRQRHRKGLFKTVIGQGQELFSVWATLVAKGLVKSPAGHHDF